MEKKPEILLEAIRHLIRSPKEREELATKLNGEIKPNAAKRLAEILLEVDENGKKK